MMVSKFDFDYCRKLIEHMKKGKSFASFGGVIGVSITTLSNWANKIDEFKHAKEIGLLCQMNEWEDIVLGQAKGDIRGSAAPTIFALKNFFPDNFKENTQLQTGNGVTVIIDTGVPSRIEEEKKDAVEVEFEEKSSSALTLEAPKLKGAELFRDMFGGEEELDL